MSGSFVVAIVGRPNVGKSALFNRIAKANASVVHKEGGVTRDRLYASCSWGDQQFTLLDTGGFDLSSSDELTRAIHAQIEQAIEEANALVFVVDARAGLLPGDSDIASILRKTDKPVIVAVNKCDVRAHQDRIFEFFALGFSEVFPVSALHGLGVGELLDRLMEIKRQELKREQAEAKGNQEDEETEKLGMNSSPIRVAIVGKPNVGKSSLVNALLGQERMTVSNVPGTTVDAVDTPFSYRGRDFVLVDTAGLRRPARIEKRLEELAVGRALKAVKRADVVLMLLDATMLPSSQDRRIAGYIRRNGKASVIIVNKMDLGFHENISKKQFRAIALYECMPIWYSTVLFISCLTKKGIERILPAVERTYQEYTKRIDTSLLNRVVREAVEINPPPREVKILYCTQVEEKQPRIVFFTRGLSKVPQAYERYLEGEIRKRFGFEGSPIIMEFRSAQRTKERRK